MRVELSTTPLSVMGSVERLSPVARAARQGWPVALITMPFVSVARPSIQLGLLKPIAESHGFPVETFHFNLDFAGQVGFRLYELLCQHRGRAVGDWLFSLAAFGDDAPDPADAFIDEFRDEMAEMLATVDSSIAELVRIRHQEVPRYLSSLVDTVPWGDFRIVGFTSTFQQNVSSFALAAELKRRWPDLLTVFGGANFEGAMGVELVRSVGCIDYAITGEADLAFPEFLVALSEQRTPVSSVPGVIRRDNEAVAEPIVGPPFERLDDLPVPDYEEYFQRAEALDLIPKSGRREIYLPFESARGCWWGAKRHCTFCGLNGSTMAFRAKSPARVEAELAELTRRYRSFELEAVDNILEPDFVATLFPLLTRAQLSYRMFYEVKANLSRPQLKALRDGGVRRIQPGLESLSSHVLGLMRKGVRASDNVNLLRWAHYYHLEVAWNLIWGFPGETEDDYRRQADLMRHLVHLPPPNGAGRIWMERFSPIFKDRKSFPSAWIRPEASSQFVYPSSVDLDKAAYFFEYELENTLPDDAYEEAKTAVRAWNKLWESDASPALRLWSAPGFIQIDDQRDADHPGTYTFYDPLASLYRACSEKPVKADAVRVRLGLANSVDEVTSALDEFVARGLMMRDGNLFLSLAIPATGGS